MTDIWIHPALLFFIAAIAIPFVNEKLRSNIILGVPVLGLLTLLLVSQGEHGVISLMGQEMVFGRVDKLSLVFGYIFVILAFIGMLYALHLKGTREHIAALVYVGGAMGAVFAGDLLSLFLFWEIMSFSSVFLIWFGGTKKSSGAGIRYLFLHTIGGILLLGGIVLHIVQTGDSSFVAITEGGWAGGLMLVGFLINAGGPPLHAWLPDSYPEASVTGTIFLATFTTKVAVYCLVRGFAGTEWLIYLGVFMTLFGIGYTIIENDIRRLLSYHIISQVGYMVAAIGIGSELALNGAVAHAINNILFKGVLMMGMGAVIFMTGKRKGTELGGLRKVMPLTCLFYMIGGLSISGFPLFNGFISKGMIISSAAEAQYGPTALLLTMAAAGTFLSTTLKLPYIVFSGDDKALKVTDPPKNMIWAMGIGSFFCILLGVFPFLLTSLLPFDVEYHSYTIDHVVGSLQVIAFAGLGFMLLLKKLKPEDTVSIDADWFYRKIAAVFMWIAARFAFLRYIT